jgi:hypothetical protein
VKIFVDENLPFMTVHELLSLGHDVMDIRGTEREGTLSLSLVEVRSTR